jgi:hypothetical protein
MLDAVLAETSHTRPLDLGLTIAALKIWDEQAN